MPQNALTRQDLQRKYLAPSELGRISFVYQYYVYNATSLHNTNSSMPKEVLILPMAVLCSNLKPSPSCTAYLPTVHCPNPKSLSLCIGGEDAQVGLVHNYMNYEPYTNTWAARIYLQPICNTMQYIWGTEVILKYFQTGKFVWQTPVGSRVDYDEGSKPGLDFIGMNYYGRYCCCNLNAAEVAA